MTLLFGALGLIAADLLLRLIRRGGSPGAAPSPTAWLRLLVNLVGLAGFFFIASTGFSARFVKDGMTGDRLLWHVASAPLFALGAVAIALFWAHRNRFARADWSRLTSAGTWAVPLRKLFFWIAVALAVPAMASILAAMLPLFDPDELQQLVEIHRACASPFAAAGLLFTYFALVSWRQRSLD